MLSIEIGCAVPGGVRLITLEVVRGCTVERAIRDSGILASCSGIDLAGNAVGMNGRVCALSDPVRDGARIEIYQALIADPKEARRRRAARRDADD